MSDLTAIFIENLVKIRKAKGLTAEALAALCPRFDRGTISKIETGQREVKLDDVADLARALEVAPDQMLRRLTVIVSVADAEQPSLTEAGAKRLTKVVFP